MKGKVRWIGDSKFEALTEEGGKILFGEKGISPMKTLLLSVAGCTAIDVVMILQKMREPLEDLEVEISGERREEHPKIYTKVHIHYKIYGNVNEEKAKRAIELSQEKYCSASAHLKLSGTEVTYSYEIIREKV
ncbi:stress-inducible protein, OsmC/Ohr family [Thermococcus litoralis DSM 5473]|uniref:Stress-inducible protein, OsmC/Ohr family n=1 Tax=Thermococcus litoralis (strain ATCC 51850 / DSM 5473 / JCM 8560 / NS-C) TaxID=523849 RepID=H3ZPV5_THELN|nr:OsmC family protein [Thermococcus litoralis]EHR78009.1 stress-inducible protein, OsmC/Ohr family [Thermococcus litoralis DSM 5473]